MMHSIHLITRFDYANYSAFNILDSSDEDSITDSGGDVSQMDDLTSTGDDFTQGAGAQQPRTGDNTQNGLNQVDFDGVNDSLANAAVAIPANGDLTLFIACSVGAAIGANKSILSGDAASNDFQFQADGTNNFRAQLNGNNGATAKAAQDELGPSVYACVWDKTGAGTYKVQVDGVDVNSGVAYTTEMNTSLLMRIGVNRGGAAFLPLGLFTYVGIPSVDPAMLIAVQRQIKGIWQTN